MQGPYVLARLGYVKRQTCKHNYVHDATGWMCCIALSQCGCALKSGYNVDICKHALANRKRRPHNKFDMAQRRLCSGVFRRSFVPSCCEL